MRHLEIEVTNAAELLATEAYGAGALLRWERAATGTGAYTEGGTKALVSGTILYDVWDAAGIETTWYRTRISNAGGTTFSAYAAPLSPVTSLASIAEVRALVQSDLGDVDLQAVIDREEAWLARRVGALAGARTQTFHIRTADADDPLWLRRPTSAVTVTDAAVTVTAVRLLRDGAMVEKTSGSWTGPVTVAYTPSDIEEVRRAIVALVRLTLDDSSFESESISDYSYSRGSADGAASPNAQRAAIVRELVPFPGPGTIRLRSPYESGRVGAVTS